MGIRPARPGELMIIPKEHVDHFCDIPDDAHILLVAQRLSRSIRRTLSPPRVGLVVHGFGVPHAHLIVATEGGTSCPVTSDAMALSLTERPLSWVREVEAPRLPPSAQPPHPASPDSTSISSSRVSALNTPFILTRCSGTYQRGLRTRGRVRR